MEDRLVGKKVDEEGDILTPQHARLKTRQHITYPLLSVRTQAARREPQAGGRYS